MDINMKLLIWIKKYVSDEYYMYKSLEDFLNIVEYQSL